MEAPVPDDLATAYKNSIELLEQATTPFGILASILDETNYRRVWSRDSIICGLAGIMADNEVVIEGMKQSILSLGKSQAKSGQIPSNVQLNHQGEVQKLSFGGLCGRVDTVSWWIIGLCNYCNYSGDRQLARDFEKVVERGLKLLRAWEFNDRGLVYVPQSGNWADEYLLRGYVLFDQLLRLWALRCAGQLYERSNWISQAADIAESLKKNYWIHTMGISDDLYHRHAYELTLKDQGPSAFWAASFSPGGYIRYFDLIANALALLLSLGDDKQNRQVVGYAEAVRLGRPFGMIPSFWPVISEGEADWDALRANHKYDFRNQPYEFQNGGIWPVWNGWWVMALASQEEKDQANQILGGMAEAVGQRGNGFFECMHGENGEAHGTRYCTWTAAGVVMAQESINGKQLFGL